MALNQREMDDRQREMWRRSALGWERRGAAMRERTAPVSRWLVDAIDPQPGQRVLELAAGPGETGFIAARRLGPNGRLLSTDQAPQMIEVARRRAAELGLENVDFDVVDAQQLEVAPGSFDAALCRWGYMLMAEPEEAMRRTRLALRDRGRLALATWGRPDQNLWMSAPIVTLVARGVLPPPNPADPSPFAMPAPADLERHLRAAGFTSIRTEVIQFPQRYQSFDDYWTETMDLAAPIADALSGLDRGAVEATQAGTRDVLSQFVAADGTIEVPAYVIVGVAEASSGP